MTDMLTAKKMASLDRALRRRTDGRVRVGTRPLSVVQAQALWYSAVAFVSDAPPTPLARLVRRLSIPVLRRDDHAMGRLLRGGTVLAVTASLAGCTTLGGNIKGDFACRAPDGICAPTSTIDDAALALIGGDPTSISPAGPYSPSIEIAPRTTLAAAAPVRSGEKVLRIVFPAHIDGAGRFRETTAVHAVVERGAWMAAGSTVVAPRASAVQSSSTGASTETSSIMPRSLGELAASAPEVQFPDFVAEVDAQIANAKATETYAPIATRSASLQSARPRAAAPNSATRPTAPAQLASRATPNPSISYSLPPRVESKAAVNPMDAIRAQVAGQLNAARPASPSPSVAAITPGSSSVVGVVKLPAKPVNGPSLFPVSEVNR